MTNIIKNILRETAVVTEQENDTAPHSANRTKGAQIDYKRIYFEIIDNYLMSLRKKFADMQEYAFF